jgi:hypothetical protein
VSSYTVHYNDGYNTVSDEFKDVEEWVVDEDGDLSILKRKDDGLYAIAIYVSGCWSRVYEV